MKPADILENILLYLYVAFLFILCGIIEYVINPILWLKAKIKREPYEPIDPMDFD